MQPAPATIAAVSQSPHSRCHWPFATACAALIASSELIKFSSAAAASPLSSKSSSSRSSLSFFCLLFFPLPFLFFSYFYSSTLLLLPSFFFSSSFFLGSYRLARPSIFFPFPPSPKLMASALCPDGLSSLASLQIVRLKLYSPELC